jgi:hypothetical protein
VIEYKGLYLLRASTDLVQVKLSTRAVHTRDLCSMHKGCLHKGCRHAGSKNMNLGAVKIQVQKAFKKPSIKLVSACFVLS